MFVSCVCLVAWCLSPVDESRDGDREHGCSHKRYNRYERARGASAQAAHAVTRCATAAANGALASQQASKQACADHEQRTSGRSTAGDA